MGDSHDSFLADMDASLAWLDTEAAPLGIDTAVVDRVETALRRERRTVDVASYEPRQALLWFVEQTARHRKLHAMDAPQIILENEDRTMRRGLLSLAAAAAHETTGLVFFGPPLPGRHVQDGVEFRWASYWDTPPEAEQEATVDVSTAYLDALGRPGWEAVWEQQCSILLLPSYPSWLTRELDPHELSIAALQTLKARQPGADGCTGWLGMRETAFLLGRLSHLLGPPPEMECPMIGLMARLDDAHYGVGASDHRGWGSPEFYIDGPAGSALTAVGGAIINAIVHEPVLADCVFHGVEQSAMVFFSTGVRGGRLIFETIDGDDAGLAPWGCVCR